MKKVFLAMIICISILFASPMQATFAKADEPSDQSRTIFVVDSKYVANTNNGIYLYDNSDKCLKLLDNSPCLSKSYYVGDCVDLYSYKNSIYLLTSTNVIIFDTQTHTTSSLEVNGLKDYHEHITVGEENGETIVCIYPTDTADGNNVIYGKLIDNQAEFFSIEFTQNELNTTTNISGLDIVEYNNQTYLIKHYSQSITAFPVSEFSDEIVLNTAITLELLPNSPSQIVSLNHIYHDDSTLFAISYQNKTDIYEFVGNKLTFKSSLSHIHQQSAFDCLDTSANGCSLAIMSNNYYYMANYSDSGFVIDSSMTNPTIEIQELSAQDFEYYKVTTQTQLISELGTNQTTNIEENSVLVKIANAKLSDNSSLLGYEYVMYTQFNSQTQTLGENLYGYVVNDNSQLEKIVQTETTRTVKVFENTKLHALPSIISDDTNSVIKNISANMPVKILCNIDGYLHEYNDTTTSYALAQVGDDIGFIDTKAIVSTDQRVILVIPNAKLVVDSNVYELSSSQSNILHQLEKGKKVKVVEGRNSDGFMKIAYNDEDGNYFEGYIKAQNISTDNYSTTQIIGTVLVLLNCVFLIILIITKRKVTN